MAVLAELEVRRRARVAIGRHRQFGSLVVVIPHGAVLADKEKEELAILNAYLPRAMSPDELAKIVRETIAELGATSKAQMGEVMKALQAKAGGRADGKTLSAEVQKQLS